MSGIPVEYNHKQRIQQMQKELLKKVDQDKNDSESESIELGSKDSWSDEAAEDEEPDDLTLED